MTHDPQRHPFTKPEGSEAEMFIQWKGTNVCLDFHCPCGVHGHIDDMFVYFVGCSGCGSIFQMGTQVIAKRVPDAGEGSVVWMDADEEDE